MYQENIKAKKKFGQNFLNNKQTIQKIVNVINPAGKKIIEIGPGLGAITKEIINETNKFIAFEIDKDMIQVLDDLQIFDNDCKTVIEGDFLQKDLSLYDGFEVVGNIPYYITSDIIFKIIDNRFLLKRAVLMVQNEVAERIVARPNSPEYSKLSITCQYVADVKKELFIGKKNFTPIPKVDSAIVSFNFHQDKQDNYYNLKDFFKLCFLQRRKKLIWSLSQTYSKDIVLKVFNILNLSENARIQELDLKTILNLYKFLNGEGCRYE
ncbi:16S rRNA (adenine(1518)-N(6)/adenine(1519)-N(6))-dimethyltransferase RsmA [Mycoplasmopsis felifaucium]|uniref:16S rRNA (adenine(1518)-N(6)/adenine(1519)-N(6))- dimethyltransferase RsmA n=1 Tax=Mycoplasmopsis felifaucium TaxID=35768 RepID=UPI000484D3A8|nr:16S rRNA (adenine(1518)-N(6)/adenine(1519)-N(6))-dimethyltransferase RsmA [Mycoplasmopsis felifaucium]